MRARSAARSATRRVAAPLENFGLPREGYEHFSRGGAALRSSTGKIKVGLLLELSTMVPLNYVNYGLKPTETTRQDRA